MLSKTLIFIFFPITVFCQLNYSEFSKIIIANYHPINSLYLNKSYLFDNTKVVQLGENTHGDSII